MVRARLWLLLAAAGLLACGGKTSSEKPDGSPGPGGDDGGLGGPIPTLLRTSSIDKVDLLFMVDNESLMADKQELLAQSVPALVSRLLAPNCVDAQGNVLGASQNGTCATGRIEFQPVPDMHMAIVTSSLGGRGSDACDPHLANPADESLSAHNDDQGHLINRAGDDEHAVTDASPANFLAWFPPVQANAGKPSPPVPAIADAGRLVMDFTDMLSGVHDHGCGFDAVNEAWYRFLVQPDPYETIVKNGTQASYAGVDATILQQRHDFLRPDSALVVIVLTHRNDRVVDPLAISGQGWAFENTAFPGSSNGAAPKGTIECATNPFDPNCTSCAFVQNSAAFTAECPGGAYLDPDDDNLNVRFFQQKRRFGISSEYPTDRYSIGLSKPDVPDSAHEHDSMGNYVGDADAQRDCVNPVFATNLPTDPTADLCHLARGPRTPDMVFYAAIAGVPHQLLQVDPSNPDSPQKAQLGDSDWLAILGRDPEQYDFTGADFHMIESETDRQGSQCPSTSASDTCDPVNGREWNTGKGDVQFACIFDLQQPRDCTLPQYLGSCDCDLNANTRDTPLCQKGGPNADMVGYGSTQIRAKAYPSVRSMLVAHRLGAQAVVSSICPIHPIEGAPGDPLFAYRPAMNAIGDTLRGALDPSCLPHALPQTSDGAAACTILVVLPEQGAACDPREGLSEPDTGVLTAFRARLESAWQAAGGASSGQPDPSTLTVCELDQLAPATCASSASAGWCYATGEQANGCQQAIIFTEGTPPPGAGVFLQCP